MKINILLLLILFMPILSCSNSPQDYIDKGNENIVDGDYSSALENFNKAIESDPNNIKAYTYRGNALRLLGDYEGAMQNYDKSIELDPNNSMAYASRGVAKIYMKQKDAGCVDLHKAEDLGDAAMEEIIEAVCEE